MRCSTKPVRIDRLEDGYERLVSPKQKVEVYFRTGSKGVVVVTTWNRTAPDRRADRPVLDGRGAEAGLRGAAEAVPEGGKPIAYRLGNLVFTTENGKRVGVVALGRGTAATYVALNATECP